MVTAMLLINLYIWDGTQWVNMGNIQGHKALKGTGPTGAQGPKAQPYL